MPTAGRLAGAITFFLYGWYIAILMGPFFPEQNPPDYLIPLGAFVGLLVGWMVVGKRAGRGYQPSIGHGLTGAFVWSFWMLFLVSFKDMIDQALRRAYDGPMESIVDIFAIMLELGQEMIDVNLIGTVVFGSIICAFVTEYFGKRYP